MRSALAAILASAALASGALADEGMWLLNAPPRTILESKYGFSPSSDWLEHVQKSAVRFGSGGSGSIISSNGLVMTNHHVGSDALAKLSTPERDLLELGFHAREEADELPCPDLELRVLWSVEDVTDRVKGAGEGKSSAEAEAARRREMAAIENESNEATGLLSEVVTLYQGGRYHLYRYKKYTDVRLVWAPEQQAAFFGGDTDNFEFPRYNIDACFFRIYEDGKPVRPEHWLRWSSDGADEGDLTFIVGHPGSTRRLYTIDHLRFLRDVEQVNTLQRLWRSEVKLQTFSRESAEHARIAKDDLFGVANGRKARTGRLAGLLDPAVMRRKQSDEAALRSAVERNSEWREDWGDAWTRIAAAVDSYEDFYVRRAAVDFSSDLYSRARTILRLSEELPKPSGDRLREYRDSNLGTVHLSLYSAAPIYETLEIEKLESALSYLAETLGGDDELVLRVLNGRSPRERAEEVVRGTGLYDIATRKSLVEGGAAAVMKARDPMIELARVLDPESRALRTRYEDEVEAVLREAYADIAAAKFAVYGESVYPDATFTLRMTFGPIVGWEENGKMVPPFTTFAGLYERADERAGDPEFILPESWKNAKSKLDLSTPYNFVCATDIIGGNSGSPVIDRDGEVVGLVFDGNIHSLPGDVIYDERKNRAVAVDSRSIIEALRVVYDAPALADEILGN